jgi:hypothetical protein
MEPMIAREKRVRGPLGQIAKWLFIGFNLLMVLWFVFAVMATSEVAATAEGSAERAGTAIGAALGFGMIIFVWLAGALVLGLAALLTRGERTVVIANRSAEGQTTENVFMDDADQDRRSTWAWVASGFFGISALISLTMGMYLSAAISFLVALCAFPILWRHPAVQEKNVHVGARWAAAITLLVVGQIFGAGRPDPATATPDAESATTSSGTAAAAATKWEVTDEKSLIDDGTNIFASVGAEQEVQGWLGSNKPYLTVRCKEGELEVFVNANTQLTTDWDVRRGQTAQVRYRVDDQEAVSVRVEPSSDGQAFFIPQPRALLNKLKASDRFVVEYTPFNAGTGTAVFTTRGADAIFMRLPSNCSA